MNESKRMDAFSHLLSWPRLTDSTHGPFNEYQGMESTIITRSSLAIINFPCNARGRVVRGIAKPNQRHTVILKAAMNQARDVPPFYYPLDILGYNALHDLGELVKTHLNTFRLMIPIMLWVVCTMKDSRGMKQSKPLI